MNKQKKQKMIFFDTYALKRAYRVLYKVGNCQSLLLLKKTAQPEKNFGYASGIL